MGVGWQGNSWCEEGSGVGGVRGELLTGIPEI